MRSRFRSLRIRLLFPLVAAALLASLVIAIASYSMGDRWAQQQIDRRYQGIAQQLSGATFPLNQQVVDSIAQLTNTQLLALRADGSVATSSLKLQSRLPVEATRLVADPSVVLDEQVQIAGQEFRFGMFPRGGPGASSDDVDRVVVLFDESSLKSARRRAAALPLVTGLSTVALLTTVALLLMGPMVRRLARLGNQVDEIAAGNFDVAINVGAHDEVGVLAGGVQRMSGQLQQMWQSLQRTHGEKLLHQIAGGLAHQLRNSLTGARMAVELHHNKCTTADDDTLLVALDQLEQTEDYVRRLLLAAAGKQDADHPGAITTTIDDVCRSLAATAKHLRVEFDWQIADELFGANVNDAPSLSAAVSNLVLNSLPVASKISLSATRNNGQLRVEVLDNGDGPPAQIVDELFEPFVTSKPEGLGLGLPLVARAAERLGGQVEWDRPNDQTRFIFTAQIVSTAGS